MSRTETCLPLQAGFRHPRYGHTRETDSSFQEHLGWQQSLPPTVLTEHWGMHLSPQSMRNEHLKIMSPPIKHNSLETAAPASLETAAQVCFHQQCILGKHTNTLHLLIFLPRTAFFHKFHESISPICVDLTHILKSGTLLYSTLFSPSQETDKTFPPIFLF